jgi:hypothetical protein
MALVIALAGAGAIKAARDRKKAKALVDDEPEWGEIIFDSYKI